ncbi:methyltransferase domain-containing protein [Aurantimonas aggregata]|uniref:Methyltransferase domain-containing protein n=1 Tax=Aurantimonas aggregata TaxID=2047720 RepID=A0A6L9MMD4_9HYPH|nr:methyltransferase domain-containing protein [Aurantimonas aggregata]NDV88690.1 methyltransferase domain-containing protein [Aurantimonas aggregata]
MPDMPGHRVFDRDLLDSRRRRWLDAGAPSAVRFLLRAVADELAERLSLVERHFPVAVDLGGHTGEMAAHLRAAGKADRVVRIERLEALLDGPDLAALGDEEALPLAEASVDLVVSTLSLHLTNDTPGVLVQCRRALRPDGLFLCGFLGGDTLSELRASLFAAEAELMGGVSPRVAPFADIRDAGALLQRAGFALPVTDQDRLTVRYDNLFQLMQDLRAMGMANMLVERSRRPSSRRLFLRAAEIYAERYADQDGRIRATFDVIYMSGWAPHESQQKPLQPGSAKASLAAALKDRSGPS